MTKTIFWWLYADCQRCDSQNFAQIANGVILKTFNIMTLSYD
jgi:hypothetical protein